MDDKTKEAEKKCDSSENKLLEPGEIIKPIIPDGIVPDLVQRIFGLKVTTCKELVSYDDKNYHVTVSSENWDNPYISEICLDGYVLKILNSMDSKRPQLIEAQHAFMQHLRNNGIRAQEAALNVYGTDMTLEKICLDKEGGATNRHGSYLVRLMKFIPGKVLGSVVFTHPTLYNIGKFIGLMQQALQKFHHPFYDTFDTVWSLTQTPKLAQFSTVVKDASNRAVCEQVIEAFKTDVIPRYSELQRGTIHGDANDNNILVTAVEGQENKVDGDIEYDVSGIIDFSDACNSYLVFDLAVASTYISICSTKAEQLNTPGYVIAGYLSKMFLNETEMEIMKICICSRLTMSLVMGAYTHSQDPTNMYVLETAEKDAWPLLHKFWSVPNDELLACWNTIIREYRSDK